MGETIRHLAPDDFESFRQIRLEALRLEPASFASRVEDWQGLTDDEWRRRLSANAVFVAFVDGEPVGIMGLMPQSSSKARHRATVIMVYVRQSMRGKGLASKLLSVLAAHASGQGIRQLELTVSATNPNAIALYQRAGFTEFGRIPGGLLQEGEEIDEIMMAKRIG